MLFHQNSHLISVGQKEQTMLLTSVSSGRLGGTCFRFTALFAVILGLAVLGSTLLLSPTTGSITGVVTDAQSGAPVADVEVRLFQRMEGARSPVQGEITLTRTNARGKYRFEDVAPGDYGIQAIHGAKASHSRHLDYAKALVTREGSTATVDLKLAEARSLKVLVLSEETGKPIPNATVSLRWRDREDHPVTDEHGIAIIPGLPQQDTQITVKAPGFQLVEMTQSINDAFTDVQIKLPPGGSIQGRVVDGQGKPLAGVNVMARPGFSPVQYDVSTSDGDGRFTLNYVPRSQTMEIRASMENYQELVDQFALNGNRQRPLELTLKPRASGGDVEVTVLDPEGRPIAAAEITNPGIRTAMPRQAKTDSQGRASLKDLQLPPSLKQSELTVRAEGFAPSVVKVPRSEDGPAKVTVKLEKGHSFRGRIVNAAGEPIAGATASTSEGNRGGTFGLGTTHAVDSDGRFSTTSLVPISTLTITAPGYTPINQMKIPLDQDKEQVITLDPTGHYRVVILDGNTKEPIRKFKARLSFATTPPPEGVSRGGGLSAELSRGKTINDENGRLFWDNLPNNSAFDLLIDADGYEPLRRASLITSRDDSDLRIELQPVDVTTLVEVAGILRDQKGQPLEGVDVHLIGLDPALAAQQRSGSDIDIQTIRNNHAADMPVCKFAQGTVTARDGRFVFPKVSKRLKLQVVYWGKDTPATRVRDLERKTAAQLARLEVVAPAAVTVAGRINLEKYPNPDRVLVQASSDHQFQSAAVDASDRSKYSVSRVAPGELRVFLYGEPVRQRGSTARSSSPLASTTVTANSGQTIEVNFD
jgi:protocatechuate 3,4-dioxygenase beta subunit